MFIKNHIFQLCEPTRFWPATSEQRAASEAFNIAPDHRSPMRTSPSFFPDAVLASFIPIFLIRHPALVIESWYKAESCVEPASIFVQTWAIPKGFELSRKLHDWYLARCPDRWERNVGPGPFHPIVVEADDILEQSVIPKLCEMCNMDPRQVPSEWNTKARTNDRHLWAKMRGLWTSTRIDKSRTSKGLNMEDKYQQWKNEFGLAIADRFLEYVRNDMEDYLYLKARKVEAI
ncbi:hypothetical protein HIM_11420 [Hirsutella minnesotensis 3608]|uniref:Sulfotransferase domain-containing protein n=1 Tax=Hirsutella minnesotensis 3608 TaxID=1043627 RepID=A0A0F7ZWL6_9HYPO|nr:hypothetical protein HIM_11420 [Hirsutella minnesotensis 3608]